MGHVLKWINSNIDEHRFFEDEVGLQQMTEKFNEIRGICPIHEGADNPSSFRYSTETKTFTCFSHHCEKRYGRSLIGIVKATRSCSYNTAVKYLEKFIGSECSEEAEEPEQRKPITEYLWDKRWGNIMQVAEETKPLNELMVRDYACNNNSYFLDRGFKQETLDHFEIGFATDGQLEGRLTIPVRDQYDRLVMMSGRDPNPESKQKYKHWWGCNKGAMLYNLNNYKKAQTTIMWIVEGFACVWRAYEFGLNNVVAIMGNMMSRQQAEMVMSNATDVIIALDNDEAGQKGVTTVIKHLKDYVNLYTVKLNYKDIADYTDKDEFDMMMLTKSKVIA